MLPQFKFTYVAWKSVTPQSPYFKKKRLEQVCTLLPYTFIICD